MNDMEEQKLKDLSSEFQSAVDDLSKARATLAKITGMLEGVNTTWNDDRFNYVLAFMSTQSSVEKTLFEVKALSNSL